MITVEKINKNFNGKQVLENVSFQVEKGHIFGLVGPNGAGKTTLIKIMMGILYADSGQTLVNGIDIRNNPQIKKTIGYVADYQSYYPMFKVKDMARLFRQTYPKWNEKRFNQLKSMLTLSENQRVRRLSKGMRTQLGLLLNLSLMPDILVLDEPTSGLDPVLRRQFLNLLVEEVAERGTTIFMSTHNLNELERICDQIVILHQGKVLLNESLEELKQNVRKIQVVFNGELPKEFTGREDILKTEQQGRVYNLVVRQNVQGIMAELKKYQPILLETVDMSLEDIFIYRMGGVGYGLEQILSQ